MSQLMKKSGHLAASEIQKTLQTQNIRHISVLGLGRFGSLFYDLLANLLGHELVHAWSPERQIPDMYSFEQACAADLIFLAVPISAFESVLHQMMKASSLENTLLVDLSSVKEHPKRILSEILPHSASAILCHPMFGPSAFLTNGNSASGFRVSFEVIRAATHLSLALRKLFEALGLEVVEIDAETHDRVTARSQFLTLVLAKLAKEAAVSHNPLETASSRKLIDLAESISVDDRLLQDYLSYNRFSKNELQRLEDIFQGYWKKLEG